MSRGSNGYAISYIGLGFSDGFAHVSDMPGWVFGSWGYHCDDGAKFSGGESQEYAELFGAGDTVGCGISNGDIYFTKNGKHLGEFQIQSIVGVGKYSQRQVLHFTGLRAGCFRW